MQTTYFKGMLLTGALMLTTLAAAAQQPVVDFATTFTLERAQIAETGTPGFWLRGGSADAAITFQRDFGLAVNLTGEHASNINNNDEDLNKISLMAGPRFTHCAARETCLFIEGLFGGVHATDSLFPSNGGVSTASEGFSMQLGGGVNVPVGNGFSIRPLEADYVHTEFPNNRADSQNDLRLAFGFSYRFHRSPKFI